MCEYQHPLQGHGYLGACLLPAIYPHHCRRESQGIVWQGGEAVERQG